MTSRGQILLCKQCTNENKTKNQDWVHTYKVPSPEIESGPEITDSSRLQRSWLDSGSRSCKRRRELWSQHGTLVLIFLAGNTAVLRSYTSLTLVQKRTGSFRTAKFQRAKIDEVFRSNSIFMYSIQATWWGTPTVLLLIHKDCKGREEKEERKLAERSDSHLKLEPTSEEIM